MNVSEYIVKFIAERNIDKVFAVVGGASLWLDKALSETKHIKTVFTNHEQTAAMAADGWARITGKPGLVFTINGPGMTNAVTGIAQAWTDSSPIILITGNSSLESLKYERDTQVRQYGTQDVRTDLIMKGITKKTILLERPEDVKECMEEAFFLAMEGRPGPVCIEVPINIQSADIKGYLEGWRKEDYVIGSSEEKEEIILHILEKISAAKKPLILAGQGVRLANAVMEFNQLIEKMNIPVVTSRMGIDIISTDNKFYLGRPGNHGSRFSHFALQSCDLLLIMGCRLAPNTTGYDADKFSGQSYKILLDVDLKELNKKDIQIEESYLWDIKDFLKDALHIAMSKEWELHNNWLERCNQWKQKYPIMQEKYYTSNRLSTYNVIEKISNRAGDNDYILVDTGSCCSIVAQVWNIKQTQRLFISGGLSSMGYWATSLGLCFSKPGDNQVICIVGDGSLQMNIQELATIKQYELPLKLFIINNGGYQFVRMSQKAYGINPPFGTDKEYGVPLPDNEQIVKAYGLNYVKCDTEEALEKTVRQVLSGAGCMVCEIFVDYEQEVQPRLKSVADEDGNFISPAYENLYPFIDEWIIREEMEDIE